MYRNMKLLPFTALRAFRPSRTTSHFARALKATAVWQQQQQHTFVSQPSPDTPNPLAPQFSTVNADEVRKFSVKSAEWWDPHGEFAMLHLMNPARIAYVREMIAGKGNRNDLPLEGMRVLDIGCGGGLLSESLVRLGAQVIGADASFENIQIAKLHARKDPALWIEPGSLEYRNTTAEHLHANRVTFDLILAMEIIEHVSHPSEFLRVCADMVRPGGHLILSTISRTPLAYLLTVVLAEDVLRMVHRGTHDWSKYIKSRELAEGIAELDGPWEVTDVRGIGWNPLAGKWVLPEQGVSPGGLEGLEVNYFLTARKGEVSREGA
ncbi:S-adenosyl-L-methionine-dependent methyltransferase [Jimgerdemannia flammicorona]|uniref:Ubiquinone biosynthesis O-methyltransferase, mitochondrial n=1 Tax=Jimgerdemannia flammicorona TaxID=994334 RepID=A0A433QCA2_9FUNG|nr:S-adenosyl-L-methionine-dependent methyltransferase [Jimgerdemannia flammicorona]